MKRLRIICYLLILSMIVIAGCGDDDAVQDENGITEPETKTIQLYFISEGERKSLTPVERTLSDGPDLLQRVSELLIAGPTSDERARGLAPVLPPATRVLSAVVSGDTLILDLSSDLITAEDFDVSAEKESLALEAISLVFGQFEVHSVRMLVEGQQQGTVNGKDIADFWGHVGLPPSIRTRTPTKATEDTTQTTGAPVDGLKLTDVRWSYEDGRLRVVFDLANIDDTEADTIPLTRAEMSSDGSEVLVFIDGVRGMEQQSPQPGSPLQLHTPVATMVMWMDEAEGDDQTAPFAVAVEPGMVSGFQLFGLTEPVRVVLDVFGQ